MSARLTADDQKFLKRARGRTKGLWVSGWLLLGFGVILPGVIVVNFDRVASRWSEAIQQHMVNELDEEWARVLALTPTTSLEEELKERLTARNRQLRAVAVGQLAVTVTIMIAVLVGGCFHQGISCLLSARTSQRFLRIVGALERGGCMESGSDWAAQGPS